MWLPRMATEEIGCTEVYLRVFDGVSRLLVIGLTLLVGTLFAQAAKADTIDFACGGAQACTGTVTQSGLNYSSTGIGVTASFENDPFTLVFDTGAGTISILENGTTEFVGTLTGVSSSTSGGLTTLDLGVYWTTVPSDVDGTDGITPFPSGSVVSIAITGDALSVDVPIITPEPAAPVLLSAGLAALGLMLKRRAVFSA